MAEAAGVERAFPETVAAPPRPGRARRRLMDQQVHAAAREALYTDLTQHIAASSWAELHVLLAVLRVAFALRVGPEAALIGVALEGIHGPLDRQERRERQRSSP